MPGADAVVLPGVGHFGEAMRRIREHGLDRAVLRAAGEGVPVLGFCVGLQLLFSESEESPGVAGIGVLPGPVRRLRTDRKLPHIGWSEVDWAPGSGLGPESGAPGGRDLLLRAHLRAASPRTSRWSWGAPATAAGSAPPPAVRA